MKERFEAFTVLISKISRNIRKIKNQEMAEYGLRSVHVTCLYYLYSAGSLTATELCERCEEDKATISRALDHLEAEGFAVRELQGDKRYKAPVSLTEKGKAAGKRVHSAVNRVLDDVGISLTDDQRRDFYTYLSVISDDLEKITFGLTK